MMTIHNDDTMTMDWEPAFSEEKDLNGKILAKPSGIWFWYVHYAKHSSFNLS